MRQIALACSLALFVVGCGGDSPTAPSAPSAPSRPSALWTASGTGNNVIDMPAYVSRVTITGRYSANSSNFIVWVGTSLIVNELLGTAWNLTVYTGTHAVGGGVTRIENSTGVIWTFTEVRQ